MWPLSVVAHDSPEHSIEELTEHIEKEGPTVPLLLTRASHYRVLGQPDKAIADLNRVLALEPNQPGALTELARIHLATGKPEASLQYIQTAIGAAGRGQIEKAHLYAARGDIYLATRDYERSLADFNRAIAADAAQIDWYLNRSWVQEQLERKNERIASLAKGYATTQSVVLQGELIDAQIAGGQAQTALRTIESRLQQSRLRSSWLIRRAQARMALNRKGELSTEARNDLNEALAEIKLRLRPTRPDTDLLLDRALAYCLLGDAEAAREDVAQAEIYEANPRRLERLERMLKLREQTPK